MAPPENFGPGLSKMPHGKLWTGVWLAQPYLNSPSKPLFLPTNVKIQLNSQGISTVPRSDTAGKKI